MPIPHSDGIKEFYEEFPYPLLSEISAKHLDGYANQVIACADLTTRKLKGKTVLDAGCGTGEIACSIGMHAQRVKGIDISENSLEHARKIAEKMKLKNIEFVQKNIFEYTQHEKFDAAISMGMAHHTQHPRKAFEIICSHVKRDGVFVFGFYHSLGGWKQRLQKFLLEMVAGKSPRKKLEWLENYLGEKLQGHKKSFWMDRVANPRERYYSVGEIKKWFKEEGFEVIGIQAHKPKIKVKNPLTTLDIFLFELFLLLHGYRFVIIAGKKLAND